MFWEWIAENNAGERNLQTRPSAGQPNSPRTGKPVRHLCRIDGEVAASSRVDVVLVCLEFPYLISPIHWRIAFALHVSEIEANPEECLLSSGFREIGCVRRPTWAASPSESSCRLAGGGSAAECIQNLIGKCDPFSRQCRACAADVSPNLLLEVFQFLQRLFKLVAIKFRA